MPKRGKGLALRIGVKKVGCSGFAYTFDYADEVRAGDQIFASHNANVVVDAGSLPFLDGSRVDYIGKVSMIRSEFDNPNVDNTCGCGESFSLKEPAKV